MGYQDLLLVLIGVTLMSLLMVNVNDNVVDAREMLQTLEIEHTATAIAQQFIEEAKSKLFDANVMIDEDDMPDNFTAYYGLGPNVLEIYPNFGDVDDYHNFVDTVYVAGVDYRVSITVHYVRDSNPGANYNNETFFKRMRVTVTSTYMPESIMLSHVFSYYGIKN